MTKFCSQCKKTKSLDEFPVSVNRKRKKALANGSTFKRSKENNREIIHHTYCKDCNAENAREFRRRHKEKTGDADYRGSGKITKYPVEDRPLISAIRSRISSTKQNCRKTNKTFDLSEDYLFQLFKKQEGKCALSGVPIQIDGNTNLRLSLDRIDSDFGYIEGNVQWTIFAANRAKGDLDLDDFITLCGLIVERATTIESTPETV